jgi:hypothetical protein
LSFVHGKPPRIGLVDDIAVLDAALDSAQIASIRDGDFSALSEVFSVGFESGDTSAWSATRPPP